MGLESAYLDVYTLVQYAGDVCWPGPESQPTFMSGTLFFGGGRIPPGVELGGSQFNTDPRFAYRGAC